LRPSLTLRHVVPRAHKSNFGIRGPQPGWRGRAPRHSPKSPRNKRGYGRVSSLSLIVMVSGGCASLDARPEIERSATCVEHATGVSADVLLFDSEAASAKTSELVKEGLSADEAVKVALLNNPRARAATLSIGVSRADFVQSTLFSNPTLALSFRFPDGGGLANFETALTQNIAELWLIPSRKQVAQRRLDRAVLRAAATMAAIAYDARRAYTHAAKARAGEAVTREALGLTEQLHEVARLRQQAGTGNEIDVNLARTRQLEAETMFRGARLATVEAYAELARVLGLSVSPETLQLTASLPEPNDWAVSPEALQRIAKENRLDLKIAEQSVGEARARAKEERARFLKSVQVGLALERAERRARGGRDWVEETFYDSLQSRQFTPPSLMPRESQGTDVIAGPTFGIEVPLWDQNLAQIARADLQVEETLQLRDALLVDVAQDIHSRLGRARTAAESAIFYRDEQLPAAERNVWLSREAYKAGRVSFLSVLEAERTYVAAKSGYLEVLEHAAIATIELEQVTGRPAAVLLSAQDSNATTYPMATPTMPEVEPRE